MLICPRCAKELEDGTLFCNYCGTNLKNNDADLLSCPVCNRTYDRDTKYCTYDGTRLAGSNDLVPTCPECGTHYSADVKYCIKDGTKVELATNTLVSLFDNSYVTYPKASPGKRLAASLLDGLITVALSLPSIFLIVNAFTHIERESFTDLLLFAMALYLAPLTYSFIKDGLGNGQSYGKRAAGIMVVNLNADSACSKGKSALRNLVSSAIAIIPYLLAISAHAAAAGIVFLLVVLVEPIMVLVRKDGRKIADLAADTMVIDVQNYSV